MKINIYLSCFIIFSQLIASDKSSINRPSGPMKTWSKETFEKFIKEVRDPNQKILSHDNRKFGLHEGNNVRTLFYNYGSIGRPNTEPSLEWPAFSSHGYAYEFGPIVGAEVIDADGDTVFIFSDGMLDGGDYDPSGGSNWWGWEPLPDYAADGQSLIANSNTPSTWGDNFPVDDDGFLVWPGQFDDGNIVADFESYFVMDDQYNAEFQYYPDPSDSTKRGIGVEVSVRGYQYAASVAEDIIFFQYEVKNASEKTLNKLVIGMIGDPHIGGAGDFGDDFAAFIDNDGIDGYTDEQLDVSGMVYCWDKQGSGNDYNIPWDELGWLGYKFLESPGISDDGIDNDSDDPGDGSMTDESQFDGIDNDGDWDLTDESAAADTAEALNYWDTKMWNGIDDDGDGRIDDWGDLDGKSDDLNGNGQPDIGEPDYELSDVDESDMIGLTSFWAPVYGTEEAGMDDIMWRRMVPGTFAAKDEIAQEADNVFIFGTGYFNLEPGESQKFSIAVVMGQGKDDLLANAKVADWIYKLGFQFTKPPDKPEVIAVPGENKVTLYWNDIAELSVDPVNGEDFEGYKIYRSNVKGEWGKVITDNQGIGVGYVPIAQFDLDDDYEGVHSVPSAEGYHMDMGSNSGITRSFVDSNLVNGITYYYAVTAYDQGSITGNLPPLECSKTIGDVNVVTVVPNSPVAGYMKPKLDLNHYQGYTTATMEASLIDHIDNDANTIYDIVISKSGNMKYLDISKVLDGDTTAVWDHTSFNEASNVWNNSLLVGPYQLYFMDIAGVFIDSMGWQSDLEFFNVNVEPYSSKTYARDIELKFFNDYADTSILVNPQPIRAQVWNVNENIQLDIVFFDNDQDNEISIGDRIIPTIGTDGIWSISFSEPADTTLSGSSPAGSSFGIFVSKPFDSEDLDDRYRITFTEASVDQSTVENEMSQIAVVPNPYVAASSFEVPPPQVFTFGRGERRVDFIHLPKECTIRIFTMAGEHIKTINHSGTLFDGTEPWNLLSKDDHDVAPGIYIYHVETPDGDEMIGRLALIK